MCTWTVGVNVCTWGVEVNVCMWAVGVNVCTWAVGVNVYAWAVGLNVCTWAVGLAVGGSRGGRGDRGPSGPGCKQLPMQLPDVVQDVHGSSADVHKVAAQEADTQALQTGKIESASTSTKLSSAST